MSKMHSKLVLVFVTTMVLFYILYNSFTFAATIRYIFDMGFNVGMGEGNLPENDLSLLMSSFWMLVGHLIFFQWCLALVRTSLGIDADGVLQTMAKKSQNTVKTVSKKTNLTPQVVVIVLLVLWIAFGVCIGVFVEKWSFIRSVNFAIGGMTTTGSQLVSNTVVSNFLCTLFLAFGVPLLSIVSTIVLVPTNTLPPTTHTMEKKNVITKKKTIQF